MRSTKTLRVLANPWMHIHIYADGVPRPAGVVGVDTVEHVPDPNRYVGASVESVEVIKRQESRRIGRHTVVTQRGRDAIRWKFATEPTLIPNTGYYRDQLQAGALIAADEETATAAGLKFVDPARALQAARDSAVAAFDAAHGPGAFDEAEQAEAERIARVEAERKAELAAKPEPKPEPTPAPTADQSQPAKRKS